LYIIIKKHPKEYKDKQIDIVVDIMCLGRTLIHLYSLIEQFLEYTTEMKQPITQREHHTDQRLRLL